MASTVEFVLNDLMKAYSRIQLDAVILKLKVMFERGALTLTLTPHSDILLNLEIMVKKLILDGKIHGVKIWSQENGRLWLINDDDLNEVDKTLMAKVEEINDKSKLIISKYENLNLN